MANKKTPLKETKKPSLDYGLSSDVMRGVQSMYTARKPAWVKGTEALSETFSAFAEKRQLEKDIEIDAEIEFNNGWGDTLKKGELKENTYNQVSDWCNTEQDGYLDSVRSKDKKKANQILIRQENASNSIQTWKGTLAIGKDLYVNKDFSNALKRDSRGMYIVGQITKQEDTKFIYNEETGEAEFEIFSHNGQVALLDLEKKRTKALADVDRAEQAIQAHVASSIPKDSDQYKKKLEQLSEYKKSIEEANSDILTEEAYNASIEAIKTDSDNREIVTYDDFSDLIGKGMKDLDTRNILFNTVGESKNLGLKGKGFNEDLIYSDIYDAVNVDNVEKVMFDKMIGGKTLYEQMAFHPDFEMSYDQLTDIFKNNEDMLGALDTHFQKDKGVENLDKGEEVDGEWVNKADEYIYLNGRERKNPNYDPKFKGDGKVDSEEINAFFGDADREAIMRAMFEKDENNQYLHFDIARDYIAKYYTEIARNNHADGLEEWEEKQND